MIAWTPVLSKLFYSISLKTQPTIVSIRVFLQYVSQHQAHDCINIYYNPQIGGCPNLSHVRVSLFLRGVNFWCACHSRMLQIFGFGPFRVWVDFGRGRPLGRMLRKLCPRRERGERGQGCSQRTSPLC